MKVKIGNETFDSERIPIAVVLTPLEKKQIYCAVQESLLKRPRDCSAFMKAPSDVPVAVGAAWLKEAVTEFQVKDIIQFEQKGEK